MGAQRNRRTGDEWEHGGIEGRGMSGSTEEQKEKSRRKCRKQEEK